MSIKIIINGANGKMGKTTVAAIEAEQDLELVGQNGHGDDLAALIKKTNADVVVDFTVPDAVFENTQTIIAAGAHPVIGTTGLTLDQIDTLKKQCDEKKLGGIIAPNFSLAAILMMDFAKTAAQYFPDVEIIEMHHAQKVDAPSGTAAKTAEIIACANTKISEKKSDSNEARGLNYQGIPVHSVRLPGQFARQQVIFGNSGETLTIDHNAIDRNCMMPGVCLCCQKVMELDHLVYGLENILL